MVAQASGLEFHASSRSSANVRDRSGMARRAIRTVLRICQSQLAAPQSLPTLGPHGHSWKPTYCVSFTT